MVATRRKAPRQEAPTTIEEATAMLGAYADKITRIEQLRADADRSLAAIEAARDAAIAPIEEEAKVAFLKLRAWWGVAGATLTEGKRKSVELAGCTIGVRITPPSLKLPGKVDAAAALLVEHGFTALVRTKYEVDKPATLKMLATKPALAELRATAANEPAHLMLDELEARIDQLGELGFSARQKEEFFIDRAAAKPANPEEVALPEAA